MKEKDWTGEKVPVIAHAEDLKHGVGAHFKLKARFEEEAIAKAQEILEAHHGNFLRASQGEYQLKFDRL